MSKLYVVVDMQNDFVYGSLGSPEARAIVPTVRALVDAWRAAGEEIVFTRDTHGEDYFSTQEGKKLPVAHCQKGTDGWQIIEGLHKGERVFDKPVFGSEELCAYVRAGDYKEITIIGVCTDICVLSNAVLIKSACPSAVVKVVANACAGVTPALHEAALQVLSSVQVEILDKLISYIV